MNNNAYGGWTPLRNALRKLDLHDTLAVIRAYAVFRTLRVNKPFPVDMEVHRDVYRNDLLILPWELEILARETIIVCSHLPSTKYTARKWDTFANLLNKLKELENYISQHLVSDEKIMQEVTLRIAHQQFKYQTEYPTKAGIVRYSRIFGHCAVEPIVKTKTGLSSKQIFTIGAVLWLKYASFFSMNYPLDELTAPGITYADYDTFMNLYSLPMKAMKKRLAAERKLDDTFLYQFHALQSHPLIYTEIHKRLGHICPIPTLLFWRITSGLFYDLIKEPGFDQAIGTSFQEYVGDMLEKTLNNTSTTIYPEEPDIRPKRADWIIDQLTSFMLVECKTKRMTLGAWTIIQNDRELQDQLDVISKAVVQSYQALEAYKNGKYRPQQYPYNPAKQASVCVVTLENWRLMGPQLDKLREIVRDKLLQAKLDPCLMERVPFVICAVNEVEELAYLLKTKDLTDIMHGYWDDKEKSGWEFIVYLRDVFKQELEAYQYVFSYQIDTAFTIT